MKKSILHIFSLSAVLVLSACSGNKASINSHSELKESNITLLNPTNTSMLTTNCQAYIDDMRAQEQTIDEEDRFKYHDLFGENGVNIDEKAKEDKNKNLSEADRKYLDKGEVNGKNSTVNNQIPDRSDKNMGVDLKFNVKEGYEAEEYTVLIADNADFINAKEIKTSSNSVNVNNLFVNKEYYWKVVSDSEESNVETFVTGDYPRWISARPLYNVRDNGGYMTYSGKRVKQGLIFRGGEITNMNSMGHYVTIADSAKEVFRNEMNIGVEIDLRGPSDINDGYKACAFAENGDIEYKQIAIKSYEETFTRTRDMVKPIFEILKQADQKHVYYHCFGGADRTGTIGFLLNGLLGVSYTDLVIDFELTSYSSINNEHIRCHIPGYQHQYDRWPALINQLKNDTTGGYKWDEDALLMDNIENFLVKACSVPQETIETIRDIMLED